ncbi:MAG: hypothetical protein NDI73_08770 [Desulfuromonadales bacterium]|nr:hypothetical protein [Desulfuromonadales bacterium]
MSEGLTEIERKLIEFATKTAETIQVQAGQIQALSHVVLVALISASEKSPEFRDDFLEKLAHIRDQFDQRPADQYTRDYFDELARFLEDPYHYAARPRWFKGVIKGGKPGEDPEKS